MRAREGLYGYKAASPREHIPANREHCHLQDETYLNGKIRAMVKDVWNGRLGGIGPVNSDRYTLLAFISNCVSVFQLKEPTQSADLGIWYSAREMWGLVLMRGADPAARFIFCVNCRANLLAGA